MKCNIPDEDVKALREAFIKGEVTKADICAKHGITIRAVSNMLRGYSYAHVEGVLVESQRPFSETPPEAKAAAIELYKQYRSMYTVAEKTGISRNTIAKFLKEAGISPTGRFKRGPESKNYKPVKATKVRKPRIKESKPSPTVKPKPVKVEAPYAPKPISDRKLKLLCNQHNAGWTYAEIAEMLDISIRDVKHYLLGSMSNA